MSQRDAALTRGARGWTRPASAAPRAPRLDPFKKGWLFGTKTIVTSLKGRVSVETARHLFGYLDELADWVDRDDPDEQAPRLPWADAP